MLSMSEETTPPQNKNEQKLPASAYVMCGWPLVLVFVGGALGGGLGGGAFAINVGIYKSNLPVAAKIALNILTGLAAIVLWIVIGGYLYQKFNG